MTPEKPGGAAAIPKDELVEEPEDEQKVQFHYIKSPLYRTVHVDGMIGGPTPVSTLAVGLYSERLLYPDQMVYEVLPEGGLGNEIVEERITREGIGREIEVSLVMSLPTARKLAQWLVRNIKAGERAIKEAKARRAELQEGGDQ
jgi:hypothetical protein